MECSQISAAEPLAELAAMKMVGSIIMRYSSRGAVAPACGLASVRSTATRGSPRQPLRGKSGRSGGSAAKKGRSQPLRPIAPPIAAPIAERAVPSGQGGQGAARSDCRRSEREGNGSIIIQSHRQLQLERALAWRPTALGMHDRGAAALLNTSSAAQVDEPGDPGTNVVA